MANGQTAAAAEADGIGERMSSIAPFENRCIKEPEKFIEAGTASALLDDAWNDKHCNDQHNTNCECDGGEEKWIWNPVNESRLAFRQEVEVGCLENNGQVLQHLLMDAIAETEPIDTTRSKTMDKSYSSLSESSSASLWSSDSEASRRS